MYIHPFTLVYPLLLASSVLSSTAINFAAPFYPTTSVDGSQSASPISSVITSSTSRSEELYTFLSYSYFNIPEQAPTALLGQIGSDGVMIIDACESLLPLDLTVSCINCVFDRSVGYYSDNLEIATGAIPVTTDILSYELDESSNKDNDDSIQVQFHFVPDAIDDSNNLENHTVDLAVTVWPNINNSKSQLGWIWWPSLCFHSLFSSRCALGILADGSNFHKRAVKNSSSSSSTVSRPLINLAFSARPQETFSEFSFSAIGTELTYHPESVFLLAGFASEKALTFVYPDTLIIDPEGRFNYHAIIENTDYSTFEFTAIANNYPSPDLYASVFLSASYLIGVTDKNTNTNSNFHKRDAAGERTLQFTGSFKSSNTLSQSSTITVYSKNIPTPSASYTIVLLTFPTFAGYFNTSITSDYVSRITSCVTTTTGEPETRVLLNSKYLPGSYKVLMITRNSHGIYETIGTEISAGPGYTGTLIGLRVNPNNEAISTYTYSVSNGLLTIYDPSGHAMTSAITVRSSTDQSNNGYRSVNSCLNKLWIYLCAISIGYLSLI